MLTRRLEFRSAPVRNLPETNQERKIIRYIMKIIIETLYDKVLTAKGLFLIGSFKRNFKEIQTVVKNCKCFSSSE